jgi:hypothetical protein
MFRSLLWFKSSLLMFRSLLWFLDKGKSALAEHVCYTKHEIAWD